MAAASRQARGDLSWRGEAFTRWTAYAGLAGIFYGAVSMIAEGVENVTLWPETT